MNLFYTGEDLKKNEGKRKAIKDSLTALKENTPWELFLPILKKAFKDKAPKAPGGPSLSASDYAKNHNSSTDLQP